jgi:hypothetical protein
VIETLKETLYFQIFHILIFIFFFSKILPVKNKRLIATRAPSLWSNICITSISSNQISVWTHKVLEFWYCQPHPQHAYRLSFLQAIPTPFVCDGQQLNLSRSATALWRSEGT